MLGNRRKRSIGLPRRKLLQQAALGLAGLALPRAAAASFVPAPSPAHSMYPRERILSSRSRVIDCSGKVPVSRGVTSHVGMTASG